VAGGIEQPAAGRSEQPGGPKGRGRSGGGQEAAPAVAAADAAAGGGTTQGAQTGDAGGASALAPAAAGVGGRQDGRGVAPAGAASVRVSQARTLQSITPTQCVKCVSGSSVRPHFAPNHTHAVLHPAT
jgi:hypothetical protein